MAEKGPAQADLAEPDMAAIADALETRAAALLPRLKDAEDAGKPGRAEFYRARIRAALDEICGPEWMPNGPRRRPRRVFGGWVPPVVCDCPSTSRTFDPPVAVLDWRDWQAWQRHLRVNHSRDPLFPDLDAALESFLAWLDGPRMLTIPTTLGIPR